MKELFVERDGFLRAALVSGKSLAALRVLKDTQKPEEGDIYKGIIKNVSAAQNAVFIDIGSARNAYLYVREKKALSSYHVGDSLMVEVLRSETGKKGAKVTDRISLTDGYAVVLKGKGHSFSKNLPPARFYEKHASAPSFPGLHLLIRSGSLELEPAEFKEKAVDLAGRFEQILQLSEHKGQPGRIYRHMGLLEDLLSMVARDELLLVHCNDPDLSDFIRSRRPQAQVTQYGAADHVFARHGLESQVDRLRSKMVPIPGGGTLIIEETEALVAIDVNSASRTGKGRQLSAFELNEAALQEALAQVSLRNLSGIIIIDFVSMDREEEGRRLYEKAAELTGRMTPLTKAYPITELGLMQIARRRQGESITRLLFAPDNRKKLAVSTSYLYKLIRIRLDESDWDMKSYRILANPVYGMELKAIETLLKTDYPGFEFHLAVSLEVETVKVMPVLRSSADEMAY